MPGIRSSRRMVSALALVVMLGLAGCGGASPTPPGGAPSTEAPSAGAPSTEAPSTEAPSTGAPSPQPDPPPPDPAMAGFYGPGTRTGIAAVDGFLDALQRGNTVELLNRHEGMQLPCVLRHGEGAPLCPEGEPAGTLVTAYPYAWCNPAFLTDREELKRYTEPVLQGDLHLFAAYTDGHVPGLDGLALPYAVVLASGLEDHSAPTVYLDQEGHLLLVRWGCGLPTLAVPPDSDLVLAPQVTLSDAERQQAEAGLNNMVADEVRQMHLFLRAALGEYDPCAESSGPCIMDTSFVGTMEGLLMRCDKIDPHAQMSGYAYDEGRHGPFFRPYQVACDLLRTAQLALGEPADLPPWRDVAQEARQVLDAAVAYLDAQR